MIRFRLIVFLSLLAAAAFAVGQDQTAKSPAASDSATITPRARAIHESAIVVDTHGDPPQRFVDEDFGIGSTDPNDVGHISLDKARRGNLCAECFSMWFEPETNQGHFA